MKILFYIYLLTLSSVLQAGSFPENVYESISIMGISIGAVQKTYPDLTVDSVSNIGHLVVNAEGVMYECSIVFEEGLVVGVSWRPRGQTCGSVLSGAFYSTYRKLASRGFRSIMESTSISGQVISGAVVEHSQQGVSVVTCFADYRRKLRVDMKYVSEPSLISSSFLISISGDEPSPVPSGSE